MSGHVVEEALGVSNKTPSDGGERLIFHRLVRVDDTLTDFHRERGYVAMCGQVLTTDELPSSLCDCTGCEDYECREVVVYCLACLRDAAKTNAECGVLR